MLRFFAPFIAPVVGALFVLALACAFFSHRDPTALQPADKYHREPNEVHYSFEGPLGRYDRQNFLRGFQVYKLVCSACHSLRLVVLLDLEEIGFTKPEVKAIAKN
ncbi:MAG: cytochrome c1, partial [Sphingomonas oligoaromativorans]